MAVYTEEIATDKVYPNLTIYRKFKDGVHYAWKMTANEGYVFYDTSENNTEIDPDTMEERPVIYYHTIASFPLNYNWDNFPYVAVPRDSVDENYIFGVTDKPENM